MTLLLVCGAGLLTSAAAMAVTAVVARSRGRVSVVDVTWGLVFVAIAWVSYAVGTGSWRSLLLALLVTVWGGRLAWHIGRRALGQGEIDLSGYVEQLHAIGYEGALALELEVKDSANRPRYIREAHTYLASLVQEVTGCQPA